MMLRSLVLIFLGALTADALRAPQPPPRRAIACSRRALLVAPLGLPLATLAADDEDKLVVRLTEARADLVSAQGALAAGNIDAVRQTIKQTTFPLTIKGYFGDSVKARAKALGDDAKAATLKADRMSVLRPLAAVDSYCYDAQMGKNPSGEEAKEQLQKAVAAMDVLIPHAREAGLALAQ